MTKSSLDLQLLQTMNLVWTPTSSGVLVQFWQRMSGLSRTVDNALANADAMPASASIKLVALSIPEFPKLKSRKIDISFADEQSLGESYITRIFFF
jgi:hypothetical protein